MKKRSWIARSSTIQERFYCHTAELFPKKTATSPHYVIPTAAPAEWRNLLRGRKIPPQDKTCYLRRFLDSLRSLGMTYRGGGTVQPNRLYLPRGGRQIAAPTSIYHVFTFFETQNDDRHVQYTAKRNKCIVGAATCRPPRGNNNLCG